MHFKIFLILLFSLPTLFLFPIKTPAQVMVLDESVPKAPLSGPAQDAIKKGYGKYIESDTALSSMVGNIIKGVLVLLGTIFLVLVVSAGYKWMTAAGNEEEVTKAKSTITEAAIGLAIIMAAWIITNFVLASLAKATI